MQQLAPSPSLQDRPPHGLATLWDMYRYHAEHLVQLTRLMGVMERLIAAPPGQWNALVGSDAPFPSTDKQDVAVRSFLVGLAKACKDAGLNHSEQLIRQSSCTSAEAMNVLWHSLTLEMKSRLYLVCPSERAQYWETDTILTDPTRKIFPVAAVEIRSAGTAYACGLWNASVFHAMRAAEVVLVALCDELGVVRNGTEAWGNMIEGIESKLTSVTKLPKASDEKKQHLQPLSEIVIDLRLFKDAWRNQNSHTSRTIVPYSDGYANSVMSAVCRVLEASALHVSRQP